MTAKAPPPESSRSPRVDAGGGAPERAGPERLAVLDEALHGLLEQRERAREDMTRLRRALGALRRGDFSVRLAADTAGPARGVAEDFNETVELLERMAGEFKRVSRLVGKQGRTDERTSTASLQGRWRECAASFNTLIADLVRPAQEAARVIGAVAKGDLSQSMALEADGRPLRGEFLRMAKTVNAMAGQLDSFASEVTRVAREVGTEGKLGGQAKVPSAAGTWRGLTDNVNLLAANLTTQVRAIAEVATAVTKGDLTRTITVEAQGEVAALKDNINEMIRNLRETTLKNTEQDWLKTNLARFWRLLQGQHDLAAVSNLILSELASLVHIQYGAFYLAEPGDTLTPHLRLLGSYAYRGDPSPPARFKFGEGLVGQCAAAGRRILLTDAPSGYIRVSSSLGEAFPANIVIVPVFFEGEVKAVVELASLERFSGTHLAFLDQLTVSIGLVLNTIEVNMRTEDLLQRSQSQARSLQAQQAALKESNEALEDKARQLSKQNEEIERKNHEVELAKRALEEKAEQLALTSKYKSQFLANMSHELRTPLNSLLILAKLLYQDSEGTLTPRQIDFAKTVYSSGSDLLALINEILDMSKIESGMITIELGELDIAELADGVERGFRQVAQDRGLEFRVTLEPGIPKTVLTDGKRLQQVLKNLLSNAFKFTERGSVCLRVGRPADGAEFENPALREAEDVVVFAVEDTGIGIPANKRSIIFEAFQQADMTTSRKYGGTGLGLTISREIAQRLGGEIRVEGSAAGGSLFTLYLPARPAPARTAPPPAAAEGRLTPRPLENALPAGRTAADTPAEAAPVVRDDRDSISPGDRVLLIAESDEPFARLLLETARESGFKGVVAPRGEAALALVRKYRPDALTLDLRLPDLDGWRVLDLLKHDAATRHIPVYVISQDAQPSRAAKAGALASLAKPASAGSLREALDALMAFIGRREKALLVLSDDEARRRCLLDLLCGGDVRAAGAATGAEALRALGEEKYDCLVLDLPLSGGCGFEWLEKLGAEPSLRGLPVVLHTARVLTRQEKARLGKLAKSLVIKEAGSPERLLAETSLHLHRPEAGLPEDKRRMLERLRLEDPSLNGRKILIVDDDIRNIFALTSLLEQHGVKVAYAENGRSAIEMLESGSAVDLVLMDVMMPDLDGYGTMRAIRRLPKLRSLPIVALTAKAMKGDREKCLQAGASDYIAKPVDIPRLLSLLRVCLER